MTVATHGLSHISLAVRDLDRAARFYAAFGCAEYFRDPKCVQLLGPAGRDVIALELMPEHAGAAGGVRHFGFRVLRAEDIDAAVEVAVAAGWTLKRRGSFGGQGVQRARPPTPAAASFPRCAHAGGGWVHRPDDAP